MRPALAPGNRNQERGRDPATILNIVLGTVGVGLGLFLIDYFDKLAMRRRQAKLDSLSETALYGSALAGAAMIHGAGSYGDGGAGDLGGAADLGAADLGGGDMGGGML
jgi:hypothetical protein